MGGKKMPFRQGVILLVVGMALLSGCSSTAVGDLGIAAQDASTTTFGNVEVTATIENSGNDVQEGTLACEVTVGGRVYEDSQRISVNGGEREVYQFKFDVPVSDFGQSGEYECTLS